MSRTIAIIGAGMAGLGAARELTQAGYSVEIYEKSRGLGGRVATRRIGENIFDHGAQVIKPDGTALGEVMQNELSTDDLVQVTAPTCLYDHTGRILSPDPDREAERKFSYRHGMTVLPKLLARSLPADRVTIRLETRLERLEAGDKCITLWQEDGRVAGEADAVIITAPAPQTADLLAASPIGKGEEKRTRIEALRAVPYHACLSVLLIYAPPAPPAPAYALLAEDRTRPLLWLAFEQMKGQERAPNGEALLIAQLGPEISGTLYDAPDTEIVAFTLETLRPLVGTNYARPIGSQVKRWRYSQPRGQADFHAVNPASLSVPVIVCGDALRPENGRVHQAYASGLEAAALCQSLLA